MVAKAELNQFFGANTPQEVIGDNEQARELYKLPYSNMLVEIFRRLDSEPKNIEETRDAVSRALLSRWFTLVREHPRVPTPWMNWPSEEVQTELTIEDIDGPIDVTQLKCARKDSFSDGEIVISFDRVRGKLEEALNPMIVRHEQRDSEGDVISTYVFTFLRGRIKEVQRDEYEVDSQGVPYQKATKLRFSPLSW